MVINPFWGTPAAGSGPTPFYVNIGGMVDNGTASVDIQVPYPPGVQANDIAFLQIVLVDSLGADTISTPAGWSVVSNNIINGQTSGGHAVFWKRLTGSESGSVTVTTTGGVQSNDTLLGIMSTWSGAIATGTPYEQQGNNNGNSTNMAGSSVTTTGTNRRIINFGCYGFNGTATTVTPSAGWNEKYDLASSSGSSGAGPKCLEIDLPAAGTLAGATHTLSASRRWEVCTLALMPV